MADTIEGPCADAIIEALSKRHEKEIWATELAFDGGARRCDFWALSAHASKGFRAIAYEVKISRADFKRDTPEKQRQARLFSDQFYYAAPEGLLTKADIPDWAGLVELRGDKLLNLVPAPLRDKDSPTWQLVASLIRNSGEVRRDADRLTEQRNSYRRMVYDARKKLKAAGQEPWKFGIHV